MNAQHEVSRDHRFVIGFLTGAFLGAGLALWLTPRSAAELRQRVADSAKGLGRQASERYRQAGARIGDAAGDLARKGQEVRDEVAGAVAHGAHEVERFATAAKSGR